MTQAIAGRLVRDTEQRSLMPCKRRTVEQLSDGEIRKAMCMSEPKCKACEILIVCRYGQEWIRRDLK